MCPANEAMRELPKANESMSEMAKYRSICARENASQQYTLTNMLLHIIAFISNLI